MVGGVGSELGSESPEVTPGDRLSSGLLSGVSKVNPKPARHAPAGPAQSPHPHPPSPSLSLSPSPLYPLTPSRRPARPDNAARASASARRGRRKPNRAPPGRELPDDHEVTASWMKIMVMRAFPDALGMSQADSPVNPRMASVRRKSGAASFGSTERGVCRQRTAIVL